MSVLVLSDETDILSSSASGDKPELCELIGKESETSKNAVKQRIPIALILSSKLNRIKNNSAKGRNR